MDTENPKNNLDRIKEPDVVEPKEEVKKEELVDIEDIKIDPSTLPIKQSSASKFVHITKKKNIVMHNINKNNDKKRFDSSDYYMKKQAEKKD
ncbi:hypothetical protein Klosneuvirus_3_101 [Klosneuvirus KNV1]|uniref:Uncharacterized protein n=1 Tax=Klosneuvirus KNV1 TaxID=1977640 RepID=A0A1V0SJS2_9VIRU|nr:hypothetical protein Klosneuvirus_3_101 [Klosneuvirus KNV1]